MMQQKDCALTYNKASHIGLRPRNEDAVLVPSDMMMSSDQKGYLFAVADGMGGHKGGALASQLACKGLDGYYQGAIKETPPWNAHRLSRH